MAELNLNIAIVHVTLFDQNCSLIWADPTRATIVDPGGEVPRILKAIERYRLTPEQITELQRRRTQGDLIYVLMADYGLSKTSVYRYLRTRDGCLMEET